MIHQVLIFFLWLFSSTAFADRAIVKNQDFEKAKKQLAKLAIKPDQADLKKENVDLWGSCFNPDWATGERTYLMIFLTVKASFKIKNITFEEGDHITLCDGKVSSIVTDRKISFSKHVCTQVIHIDGKGKMCRCYLGDPYTDRGIEILERAHIYIHQDKIYAFSGEAFIKKTKTKLPEGTYEFNNGKPKRRDWDSADTCDGIMIR